MLQDSKLDLLQNEDDVRKLLEHGTMKKVAPPPPPASVVTSEEDESGYASTVIKTLADTKLWKKFFGPSGRCPRDGRHLGGQQGGARSQNLGGSGFFWMGMGGTRCSAGLTRDTDASIKDDYAAYQQ